MNRSILLITCVICLLYYAVPAMANNSITVDMEEQMSESEPEDPDDIPSKGLRSPSRRIMCKLNMDSKTILLQYSLEITSFELWDSELNYSIIITDDPNIFVDRLLYLEGCYKLKLISESHKYVGSLCL